MRDLIDAVAAEPDVPLLATPGSMRLRDVKGLIAKSAHDPRSLFLVAEVAGRLAGNLGGSGPCLRPLGARVRVRHVGRRRRTAASASAPPCSRRRSPGPPSVGYAKVVLSAFPHNTRAIVFYERHGFTLEGCRARQFHRDGRYLDELIMGRLIAAAAD